MMAGNWMTKPMTKMYDPSFVCVMCNTSKQQKRVTVNFQVSNHGPVCSCPDGYQGDPLSQCFRSRRGWIRAFLKVESLRAMKYFMMKHIRSLENIRTGICFCWTFHYLLKTMALPKRHAIGKFGLVSATFQFFRRKIVVRRGQHLDWSIYLQLHSLETYFLRSENIIEGREEMHKYIWDEKLNCPRAYLPGAVLGWKT